MNSNYNYYDFLKQFTANGLRKIIINFIQPYTECLYIIITNSERIIFRQQFSNVDAESSYISLRALSCNLLILLFVVLL